MPDARSFWPGGEAGPVAAWHFSVLRWSTSSKHMGVSLVDRDLPGITGASLALLQRAEITARRQLTAAGQPVRYLRSIGIVGEARCMCLFEVEDAAAVTALNKAAQLPFTRILTP